MYKWDYWTYMAQPSWFIEAIIGKYEIDVKRKAPSDKGTTQ